MTDCDDTTGWVETVTNMLPADATLTVDNGDIFKLDVTFDDGATNESVQYAKAIGNISSNTYTHYVLRYKTSHASAGAHAGADIEFSVPPNQEILDDAYSTGWATTSGTVTSGKTINGFALHADDDGQDGNFQVYFDFALLCKAAFTFPETDNISLELANRYADLEIPGRVGDRNQWLSMPCPIIRLRGPMSNAASTTWGTRTQGEWLYRIFHMAHEEDFQWFTSDLVNCKVTPRLFTINQPGGSGHPYTWDAEFRMYGLSSGDLTTWEDLRWFGV